RGVGLADPPAARPRGEGAPPEEGDRTRARVVRSRAARAGAGAGGAPQRAARRHLAAHGPRPLAPGAASHRGVGRRGRAVRPRPRGGSGAARRSRVVSTAGTLCRRTRGGRPSSFNFVTIEPTAVHITYFRWDVGSRRFRASDTYAFARAGMGAARVPAPAPAPPPPPAQPVPADTTSHS